MSGLDAIGGALRAYGATAAGQPGAGIGATGDGFEAALGQALSGVAESARAADTATQGALTGQVGTTDVVLAVSRAELALQTAVALRDRVVAAYQDVMRMAL